MIQNDENCRIIAMFEIKYLPYLQRYLDIRLRTLSPVPEAAACLISMSSTPRKTKNYFFEFLKISILNFSKSLGIFGILFACTLGISAMPVNFGAVHF
jgi:hypothetical protein